MKEKKTDTDSLTDAVDYIMIVQEKHNRPLMYFDKVSAMPAKQFDDVAAEVMKNGMIEVCYFSIFYY